MVNAKVIVVGTPATPTGAVAATWIGNRVPNVGTDDWTANEFVPVASLNTRDGAGMFVRIPSMAGSLKLNEQVIKPLVGMMFVQVKVEPARIPSVFRIVTLVKTVSVTVASKGIANGL